MKKIKHFFSENCCICNEILNSRFPEKLRRIYSIENRVCYENENFIVIPSVSPIVEGHLMLIPKKHIKSLAYVDMDTLDSFKELVKKVFSFIKTKYCEPFLFEHGVGEDEFTGCGIDHAHLHILPIQLENQNRIFNAILSERNILHAGNMYELLSSIDKRKSYLLFGCQVNNMYFSTAEGAKSQYIRKIISSIVGNKNWNWNEYYGVNEFLSTYNSFKNFLTKESL